MVQLSDIFSVTEFQRHTRDHLKRLERSRRPLALTVNGRVKAVVLDPRSYQHLEALRDQFETLAAVGEGLADVRAGRTQLARPFVGEDGQEASLGETRGMKYRVEMTRRARATSRACIDG